MFEGIFFNIKNKFCFQEKQVGDYLIKNANIYKRIFAFCIDIIILFFIIVLLFNIILPKDTFTELMLVGNEKVVEEFISKDSNKLILQKMFNMMFFVLLSYFFISNLYFNSTLGQKFFKLKLVSVQGKKITKYDIFNKSLFVSFFISTLNIHLILLFFIIPLIISNFKFTFVDVITNTNIIEVKKIKKIC